MKERLAHLYAAALQRRSHDPARLERLVQELVDLAAEDLNEVLALAELGVTEDPEAEHPVAVAVLTIGLATRMDLPRQLVAELGMMALTLVPEHAADPVIELARRGAVDDEALRSALVAADWRRDHAAADGGPPPRPLARILRVAADFDRLVRLAGSPAPAAAETLRAGAGGTYDPVVVDQLVAMLGLDRRSDTTPLGALELKRTRTPTPDE